MLRRMRPTSTSMTRFSNRGGCVTKKRMATPLKHSRQKSPKAISCRIILSCDARLLIGRSEIAPMSAANFPVCIGSQRSHLDLADAYLMREEIDTEKTQLSIDVADQEFQRSGFSKGIAYVHIWLPDWGYLITTSLIAKTIISFQSRLTIVCCVMESRAIVPNRFLTLPQSPI